MATFPLSFASEIRAVDFSDVSACCLTYGSASEHEWLPTWKLPYRLFLIPPWLLLQFAGRIRCLNLNLNGIWQWREATGKMCFLILLLPMYLLKGLSLLHVSSSVSTSLLSSNPCVLFSLQYSSGTAWAGHAFFQRAFPTIKALFHELWWWEVDRDFQRACPKPEAPPVSSWEDVWKGTRLKIQHIISGPQAHICITQGWTRRDRNQRLLYLHSGWP